MINKGLSILPRSVVSGLAALVLGLAGCSSPSQATSHEDSTPEGWSVTNLSQLAPNSATHNLNWSSIASSADGTKLAATDDGGSGHTGNLWMSADSGATWTNVSTLSGNSGLASRWWQAVTMSADGTKVAAVVNAGNIWVSDDSGATWTDASSEAGGSGTAGGWWGSITSSADGTKLAIAAWSGDIWTSLDSGTTWTDASTRSGSNLTPGLGWHSLAMSEDGTKIAAAQESANGGDASLGDIWTSSDSGLTWTNATSSAGLAGMRWASVTASSNGTKLAAVEKTTNHIWTSSDSGETWEDASSGSAFASHTWGWKSITSSADGSKLLAVDGYQEAAVSFDSGAHWTIVDWAFATAVELSSDGTTFAALGANGDLWSGVLGHL